MLITAGTGYLKDTNFLVIEVEKGGYIADLIIEPYKDAGGAVEKLQRIASLHGQQGELFDLWTDERAILGLAYSIVGVNAQPKHKMDIKPIIDQHLRQSADVLIEFYELEKPEEQKQNVNHRLRWFFIKQLERLIQFIKNWGQNKNGEN